MGLSQRINNFLLQSFIIDTPPRLCEIEMPDACVMPCLLSEEWNPFLRSLSYGRIVINAVKPLRVAHCIVKKVAIWSHCNHQCPRRDV